MSRREQIGMSEEEIGAFLDEQRVLTCATIGPRGWPHLMPLWYVVREPDRSLWAWTYAASQKVRNLERDARATVQVEAGEGYEELRGVTMECEVELHRAPEFVRELGLELFARYAPAHAVPGAGGSVRDLPAEVVAMVERQARKRVALQFIENRHASWDHRKLGGVY